MEEGNKSPDLFETIVRERQQRHDLYEQDVLASLEFQNGLKYLQGISDHFLIAQSYVRLQGSRLSDWSSYLMLRFAPQFAESVLAIGWNAKEGLQNPARRELRFLLEAAVKCSARDFDTVAGTLEERLSGLNDREKRFEDYVVELRYFDDFEQPKAANDCLLSLYSELSRYVHPTEPQFLEAIHRAKKGETPGMESVATLNHFNKLAFRVFDLALVRIFYTIGPSMAGDIFTTVLDDEPDWRFHKGKFINQMSRCFDYKHERRIRRGEIT
ncbi:MAG: hypothetical protein GC155_18320 [Alphaproteobacteria bacterium]|nr:hypothetical protein [Alphaproteobacteria bacterium]